MHPELRYESALELLKQLIAIPSLSRQEDKTADCLQLFLHEKGIPVFRQGNNVYAFNQFFDDAKPSILLNSHHDTVPANKAYTHDPHLPFIREGKLFGLGATDAGASLVSLLAAFIHFYETPVMPYNIVFAATAEEEISGANGIEKLFIEPRFAAAFRQPGSFAIIGEPTQLELAIAEKGLLVLDCEAEGRAGHAAREEGDNAIYKALDAIEWFRHFRFEKVSPLVGEVKMTVTAIQTENKTHNIVPAGCSFVVDIRINECYTHEELLEIIRDHVAVKVMPRSMRLRSSSIDEQHPVVQAGKALGKQVYGSPTLSDKALVPISALKCGPGNSEQSHSADEFVTLEDIRLGIEFYIELIERVGKGIS